MNHEVSRLRTFKNWPSNAPVDSQRIAKGGFYFTGRGLEVQCFSCGARISEWNYGDKVMARHRVLDPGCKFVRNPTKAGNVPIVNNAQGSTSQNQPQAPAITRDVFSLFENSRGNKNKLNNAKEREKTFSNWPIPNVIQPKHLAESGFYYTNNADKVRCVSCKGVIGDWETGDIPDVEHLKHFPVCEFIKNKLSNTGTTISFGLNFQELSRCSNGQILKELGVQSHRVPKHKNFTTFESRLASFSGWPSSVSQKPEELAEAGFFYCGKIDHVRCFHCDGGLLRWDHEDIPWIEHARSFPNCGFVLLVKGQQFIDEAEELRNRQLDSEFQVLNVVRDMVRDMPVIPTFNKIKNVTDDELDNLMNTPVVQLALSAGLEWGRVKRAVKQKVEMTGWPFRTGEDLIEAAIYQQGEEEASYDAWQEAEDTIPERSIVNNRERMGTITEHQEPCEMLLSPINEIPHSTNSTDPSSSQVSNQTTPTHNSSNYDSQITSAADYSESDDDNDDLYFEVENTDIDDIMETEDISPKKNIEDSKKNFSSLTLEEENRKLKEARMCKICMDDDVSVVFLPCGHLATCVHCAHSLTNCPLCRQPIKAPDDDTKKVSKLSPMS